MTNFNRGDSVMLSPNINDEYGIAGKTYIVDEVDNRCHCFSIVGIDDYVIFDTRCFTKV